MLRRLPELARLFLKLGAISFGGPAAHLAIMEEEVVHRREWVSRRHFLDLIGICNLMPGPNAIEMAGHVGYARAGLLGSIVGGLCFTVPSVAMTLALAWAYGRYGRLPQVEAFFYGIKPAVLAVVFAAIWRLGRKALAGWQVFLVGAGVAVAVFLGVNEIVALLSASLLGVLLLALTRRNDASKGAAASGLAVGTVVAGASRTAQAATAAAAGAAGTATAGAMSLWKLGLFFLQVGAVWYGGGYVLLAYLEGGLVGPETGFSQQQLIDAVAIGQLTPGPMLTCATFAGYLIAGFPGALVATAAIVSPSFFFVAVANPILPRLRRSLWASRFLDAVSAGCVGLMIAVSVTLTRSTLVDWPRLLIAVSACAVALRWRPSPVWLVLGGALGGRILLWVA